MRPGPKKPGESAAEYNARVKAMEQKWMSGIGRPKTSGTKPTGASAGGGRGGMTPPPGMMYGPNDALIPIPKKGVKPVVTTPRPIRSGINDGLGNGVRGSVNGVRGGVKGGAGTGGGRGAAPRPGYGGGKPKR